MTLSEQAVTEFQDLHEQKFGYRPTPDQAEHDLLILMRVVVLTQPEKDYETGAE